MSEFSLHFLKAVVLSGVSFIYLLYFFFVLVGSLCFNLARNPSLKIGLLKLKGIGRVMHIACVRVTFAALSLCAGLYMFWLH